MDINYWNSPYHLAKAPTVEQLQAIVDEKLQTERYELIGEFQKKYVESRGNLWYAKLKRKPPA